MDKMWRKILVVVLCLFGTVFFAGKASAVVNNADIMKKWIFTQYYTCIRDSNLKRAVEQKNSGAVVDSIFETGSNKGALALPSYNFQHSLGTTKPSCKELFIGNSKLTGVLGYAGWSGNENINWSNVSASQNFLIKLGYSLGESDSEGVRFTINANKKSKQRAMGKDTTGWVDGGTSSVVVTVGKDSNGKTKYNYSKWENAFSDFDIDTSGGRFKMSLSMPVALGDMSGWGCYATGGATNKTIDIEQKDDVEEFFNDLRREFSGTIWQRTCGNAYVDTLESWEFSADNMVDAGGEGDFIYAKDKNSYDVSNDVIKNMSGMGISGLALTDSERYVLYVYYLNSFLPDDGIERITCSSDGSGLIWLKDTDGEFKKCSVNFSGKESSMNNELYTQYFDGRNRQPYPYIGAITMQGIIDWLSTVNTNNLTDVPTPTSINGKPISGGGKPSTDGSSACDKNSGKLGWLLCSVLNLMSEASTSMYNKFVAPALMVQPTLFRVNDGDNNDAKDAWSIFQGFANVIFIILFLVVIFSQLTGVGIDNYGIKKILPKLIVAAILVNLSYYICIICVDVSNIVGNGVQSIFNGMSASFKVAAVEGVKVQSGAAGTAFLATGVLAAGIGIAATIANPAIILSLLVSALGIIIAVFFLFLLLSARQAAIVMLIVISPLAFVCYMLPNTKKLFDKWLNIWKALLLLYPICGLLVGGGDFVSRLLMNVSNGSFFMGFTAMMAGIAPIFFIPSLLKSSFAAMGNLGAKISGVGQKLRGGAEKGIRSSEGYKNAQKMGLEHRTRMKAGLKKDGTLSKAGERRAKRAQTPLGKLVGADKRRAAYIAAAKKDIAASEAADASLTKELARTGIGSKDNEGALVLDGETLFAGNTEGAYYGKRFVKAAEKGDLTGMNAAIEAMKKSGMKSKDIAKVIRYADNDGKLDGIDTATRNAWMTDTVKKHGDILGTDAELLNYFQTGDSTRTLGKYGSYASNSSYMDLNDIEPEAVLKLSSDSMAALITSGLINKSMAQRVMAMNPNLSADKKIMLGATAAGKINSGTYRPSDLKKDAEELSMGRSASNGTINALANSSEVNAWTAASPQDVNVVQNFAGGGQQYEPVDVRWKGGSGSTDTSTPVPGGPTPTPTPGPGPTPTPTPTPGPTPTPTPIPGGPTPTPTPTPTPGPTPTPTPIPGGPTPTPTPTPGPGPTPTPTPTPGPGPTPTPAPTPGPGPTPTPTSAPTSSGPAPDMVIIDDTPVDFAEAQRITNSNNARAAAAAMESGQKPNAQQQRLNDMRNNLANQRDWSRVPNVAQQRLDNMRRNLNNQRKK